MPLRDILTEIESYEFSAEIAIASDAAHALELLRDHPLVERLIAETEATEAQLRLVRRALALCEREPDPRYENPSDAALFAYMFAARSHSTGLARMIARHVHRAPNLWLARNFALRLLTSSPTRNEETGDYRAPDESPSRTNVNLERSGDRHLGARVSRDELERLLNAEVGTRERGEGAYPDHNGIPDESASRVRSDSDTQTYAAA